MREQCSEIASRFIWVLRKEPGHEIKLQLHNWEDKVLKPSSPTDPFNKSKYWWLLISYWETYPLCLLTVCFLVIYTTQKGKLVMFLHFKLTCCALTDCKDLWPIATYGISPLNLHLISDNRYLLATVPCVCHIPSEEVCLWLKHTASEDAGLHWEKSVTKWQIILTFFIYLIYYIIISCRHFHVNITILIFIKMFL